MKTFTSLSFVILMSLSNSYGQVTYNMDSLWTIWKNNEVNDSTRIKAMNHISWSGYLFSKPDSAFALAQLQYDLAEKNDFKIQMANAKNTQAVSFYVKGQVDKAIEYFQYCLDIKKQTNDVHGIAASLNNLAIIFSRIGDYEKANIYFEDALEIFKNINNEDNVAKTQNNLGNNYKDLGLYEKALNHHYEALKTQQKTDNLNGIAVSLNSIGLVYEKQGNLTYALQLYKKSVALVKQTGNIRSHAIYLNSIGNIFLNQSQIDSAQFYYQNAINKFELINDQNGITDGYGNLGTIFKIKGIEQINQNIAPNYLDSALNYFNKNLQFNSKLRNQFGIGLSYLNIGKVYYELGQLDSAKVNLNKALNTIIETGLNYETINIYKSLYYLELKSNDLIKSEEHILKVLELRQDELNTNFMVLSESEKELYFNTMLDDYLIFNDFALINQKNNSSITDIAYNNALRNKGLLLKSSTALRFAILNSGDQELLRKYNEWLELKKNIARKYANGEKTDDLIKKANEVEKELIKNSPYFNDFNNLKKIDWKDVQKSLIENEAAIEFIQYYNHKENNKKYYAAIIINKTCEHPKIVKLCSEQSLEKHLSSFNGNNLNYINNLYNYKNDSTKSLFKLVWHPIKNEFKNIKTIYYSPTGLLHKISFASIALNKNVLLSDNFNLHLKSSTGKITNNAKSKSIDKTSISLFGGINYGGEKDNEKVWNYLPGTLREVEDISLRLKKKKLNFDLYVNNLATEKTFKEVALNSNILHIASHGYFFPDPSEIKNKLEVDTTEDQNINFRGILNARGMRNFVLNKNPLMRSGIAFSGANNVWQSQEMTLENDGVLTAQEVSTLDMHNTNLVVLSACETGLGDIRGSEGVYGLQRAFKIAGVKYIIMSLWQVPDEETSEFMSLFYKNLLRTNQIEIAFQKTQKIMRKKYAPYYWAAFVLIE